MGGDNVLTIDAGLPNIEGTAEMFAGLYLSNDWNGSLQFTPSTLSGGTAAAGPGWNKGKLKFNAAHNNSVYGKSDTVQPPSLSLLPQIKF